MADAPVAMMSASHVYVAVSPNKVIGFSDSFAVWILTQMKRWGYLKGDVKYKDIVHQVYLLTDAKKRMKEVGMAVAEKQAKKIIVMGKPFDETKPQAYVDSFKIKKLA